MEKSLLAMSTKDAQLAYQQSYSMVKYMISSYGWFKVREILVNLGNGMNINDAIVEAFADFGLDYNTLVQEWEAQMVKEQGSRTEIHVQEPKVSSRNIKMSYWQER